MFRRKTTFELGQKKSLFDIVRFGDAVEVDQTACVRLRLQRVLEDVDGFPSKKVTKVNK